jgi:hypothetical protein
MNVEHRTSNIKHRISNNITSRSIAVDRFFSNLGSRPVSKRRAGSTFPAKPELVIRNEKLGMKYNADETSALPGGNTMRTRRPCSQEEIQCGRDVRAPRNIDFLPGGSGVLVIVRCSWSPGMFFAPPHHSGRVRLHTGRAPLWGRLREKG